MQSRMKSSNSKNIEFTMQRMKKFLILILIIIFFLIIPSSGFAQIKNDAPQQLRKTTGSPGLTKFNINNISTFIRNNGDSDNNPNGNSGLEYPKGSNYQAVFQSGFVLGGKDDGEISVGGSTYRQGLIPGAVDLSRSTKREDENAEHVRIYRVRRVWVDGNLQSEVNDEGKTEDEIRDQYHKDWNEWPAQFGAPFDDVDKYGKSNPKIDSPGVPGADQTIWFVANDMDTVLCRRLYGSDPIGLEMQATFWGYNISPPLGNTMFRKYKLINYSGKAITDMYFSMWSDPDLGGAGDDFVGCDTSLNLMYVYNGKESDEQYGNNIPSVGFVLLDQLLHQNSDTQIYAAYFFIGGDPVYNDPNLGSYNYGTIEMYRLLQGRIGTTGELFFNPVTNKFTRYCLTGDPVSGSGWVDGILHPPGDRRIGISTGPFVFASADTQTVIFAELAAGVVPETDKLSSVELLREYASVIKNLYNSSLNVKFLVTPKLRARGYDRRILLDWDFPEIDNELENFKSGEFSFQGYQILQFAGPPEEIAKVAEIATYDKVDKIRTVLQDVWGGGLINVFYRKYSGRDTGIKRHIYIDHDQITDSQLFNGSVLYFGVRAYACTKSDSYLGLKVLGSQLARVSVIPQTPKPGVRYNAEYGDEIWANQLSGSGVSNVYAFVVDPSVLTGNEYQLTIDDTLNSLPVWSLTNVSLNKKILTDYYNPDPFNDNPITDGFIVEFKEGANYPGDEYSFTLPGVSYDLKTELDDVDKINVFPNPYYGFNPQERSKYEQFITFSHLPRRAVFRIFNLAGQQVIKFEKDSDYQYLRWDMRVPGGLPIGNGVYIAYIELPDLGKVKVLKFSVILQMQQCDRF